MTMIRKLYNQGRHFIKKEETIESGLSALVGWSLGYMGHGGKLDRNGVPLDALAGLALMYGGQYIPIVNQHDKRTREISSAAIAVGMARAGDRAAASGAGPMPHLLHPAAHHGEGGYSGSMAGGSFGRHFGFGQESSLVRAASRL
jgi:hypothetical protein